MAPCGRAGARFVSRLEHDDVATFEGHGTRAPRIAQKAENLFERFPIRTGQLRVLEHVLQLQFELGDRLRLIERNQRPAIRQRYQDHSGAPLERAARMYQDDRMTAKGGELRGRVRRGEELGLRQSHDRATEVGVNPAQRFDDVLRQRQGNGSGWRAEFPRTAAAWKDVDRTRQSRQCERTFRIGCG